MTFDGVDGARSSLVRLAARCALRAAFLVILCVRPRSLVDRIRSCSRVVAARRHRPAFSRAPPRPLRALRSSFSDSADASPSPRRCRGAIAARHLSKASTALLASFAASQCRPTSCHRSCARRQSRRSRADRAWKGKSMKPCMTALTGKTSTNSAHQDQEDSRGDAGCLCCLFSAKTQEASRLTLTWSTLASAVAQGPLCSREFRTVQVAGLEELAASAELAEVAAQSSAVLKASAAARATWVAASRGRPSLALTRPSWISMFAVACIN